MDRLLLSGWSVLFGDATVPERWEVANKILDNFGTLLRSDEVLAEGCLRSILEMSSFPDLEIEELILKKARQIAEELWHPVPQEVASVLNNRLMALL